MNNFEFAPIIVQTLEVDAMTCGHCKTKVEKLLNEMSEVESAEVDLIDGTVEVKMNKEISNEIFKEILDNAGYPLLSVVQ
jgi:Cu+-exporting ATPase